jgi:hypothetical protein
MLQTCMNEQPKSKRLRGDSNVDASRRARTAIHTKRPASRRQSAEPNKSVAADRPFHPARGLMICMGWLRLFHAITSANIPSTRELFHHES